ncbi:TIGR01906 family membrane protein [Ligilactobacillus agilis]|uniref:TIGR01906 family membrane protein n=1 Tax=Ligilactobacillus agilis TaxID=1601 RepID=UPI0034E2C0FE
MNKLKLTEGLLLVVFYLAIFSACIAITINFRGLYYYFVWHQDLGSKVGLSNHQLITTYQRLLAYLNYPWVQQLDLGLPTSFNAMHHFTEVKALFFKNYLILATSFPVSCWWLKGLWQKRRLFILITPCYYLLSLGVVVLTLMVTNFNKFFVTFHRLLFANDDWLFDPKLDPIINALPASYFLAAFSLFILLVFVFLVGIIGIARYQLKYL